MNLKKQLKKCDDAYENGDYTELFKLSDEILRIEPENQNAIGYKSIAYVFQNQPEKAIEMLENAIEIHPNNYYLKNHLSMAYYDIGEYEKSLKYAEEGLKIKKFDWLSENKIKALIKLNRIEEAEEIWQNTILYHDFDDYLIEAEKYDEAIEYAKEEYVDGYYNTIDKVKRQNPQKAKDYYLKWIDEIKGFTSTRTCPDCGGPLMPIVYGYPRPDMLEKADQNIIFLGGCIIPPNPANYHCKDCNHEFDLGCNGLEIELSELYGYTEYKIQELTKRLREDEMIWVRSKMELKSELDGYDDEEFNLLITHLIDLGYLCEPKEGFVKLSDFEDMKSMKEYCDDGKYAAPEWLAFPEYSLSSIGWRMGLGENYIMNMPRPTKEYEKLFPKPRTWIIDAERSHNGPYPPLADFWTKEGQPEYPKNAGGIRVDDFLTLADEKEFQSDGFSFKSIEHAMELSRKLYFERYHDKKPDELTAEDEKIWDKFKYSVLLNASYFKIMQDEELREKLLMTGDEALVYESGDDDNLFGRALMEVRDEIRRITENINLIDWSYTEYLKYKPWI